MKTNIPLFLLLAITYLQQPSFTKGLAFWKNSSTTKDPKTGIPLKCNQQGVILTQRCICEELRANLDKVKTKVNSGQLAPTLSSMKAIFEETFLVGRGIHASGNLKIFSSNKQCEIYHWQLESLKYKHLYFSSTIEALEKEYKNATRCVGVTISLHRASKDEKDGENGLPEIDDKIKCQLEAKKIKHKITKQSETSFYSILDDINDTFGNADSCLDKSKISKLPFK